MCRKEQQNKLNQLLRNNDITPQEYQILKNKITKDEQTKKQLK